MTDVPGSLRASPPPGVTAQVVPVVFLLGGRYDDSATDCTVALTGVGLAGPYPIG